MTTTTPALSTLFSSYRWPIVSLIIAALLALHPFPLFAGSNPAGEKSGEKIRLGILELTPYGFEDVDGAPKGYLYEIAKAVLEDTKLDYSLSLIPLKRLHIEVAEKREDCLFIALSDYTEEKYRFVEPIGKSIPGGILSRAGHDIDVYEDLKQYSIGVPLGVAFGHRFDKDDNLDKVSTPDYSKSVKMLLYDRVDAIAGNIDSFHYYARQLGKKPGAVFGKPLIFFHLPIWLACGKTTPNDDAMERLRVSMSKLRENGTVQQIIGRYH